MSFLFSILISIIVDFNIILNVHHSGINPQNILIDCEIQKEQAQCVLSKNNFNQQISSHRFRERAVSQKYVPNFSFILTYCYWVSNPNQPHRRVAEVAREHRWYPPKSLDPDENFKPAILSRIKICRDLHTFWRSLGKKSAFLGQKQCFLGKKCTITWYILHISLS